MRNRLLVSLTFDDALDVHLDTALPLLDKYQTQGTFYVNLNAPAFVRRLHEWQAASTRGHELGNHTIFHPAVASKPYISEGNALENYTLDRMRIELATANQFLSAIDGKQERTYAYTCCNSVLGRPGLVKRFLFRYGLDRTRIAGWMYRWPALDFLSHEQNYSGLVSDLFVAARGGENPAGADRITSADRNFVPCVSADGKSADELLATVDTFARHGNWLIFMFHGIGGGHRLSCEPDALERLLDRLTKDPGIKVTTFIDAAGTILY